MPPHSNSKKSHIAVTPPAPSALSTLRMFAIPDIEGLSVRERGYLRDFHSFKYPAPYRPLLSLTSRLGYPGAVELYQVFDLNGYSSNLYRSAIFVLMSYYLKSNNPSDTDDTDETTRYIIKYRGEVQDYLNNDSLVEVVYASYVVAIYSIVGGDSVKVAMTYCHDFCKSIVALTRKQGTMDDWIELLWRDALTALYYVHRNMIIGYSVELLDKWEALLDTSYCLLIKYADVDDIPVSMKTEQICHKIKSLSIYMQFYLDIFLIRVNLTEGSPEMTIARDRLYSILGRIIRLVSHLSNISDYIYHAYRQVPISDLSANCFSLYAAVEPRGLKAGAEPLVRDTALALLYAFARLLKNMLEPTADINEKINSGIYQSAIAICRLCANLSVEVPMETWIVKRSLFWAGMVLTENKYPLGQLPDVLAI